MNFLNVHFLCFKGEILPKTNLIKLKEWSCKIYFLCIWADCECKAWKLLGLSCWVIFYFPLKDLSIQQNECSLETYWVVFILKLIFSFLKKFQYPHLFSEAKALYLNLGQNLSQDHLYSCVLERVASLAQLSLSFFITIWKTESYYFLS